MDDRTMTAMFDLMATHKDDFVSAAKGDAGAIQRIAYTSRYLRDDVVLAVELFSRLAGTGGQ